MPLLRNRRIAFVIAGVLLLGFLLISGFALSRLPNDKPGWAIIALMPGIIVDVAVLGLKDDNGRRRLLHEFTTIVGAWCFWMVPMWFLIAQATGKNPKGQSRK